MNDTNWRDRPWLFLPGSVAASAASWWLARITADDPDRGRYSLELVSYTSSFLFVAFALLAAVLAVVALLAVVRRGPRLKR